MDRVFLDANVLFSAAYRPDSRLLRLWEFDSVHLITSDYASSEARVNLPAASQLERLGQLLESVEAVSSAGLLSEQESAGLPEKDRPILEAAIAAEATHLLTGDKTHFGKLYGSRIGGALILPPASYLNQFKPSA
ncbi:MAG: PIN domain-containing protein [Acidobacteriota bacterium]